MTTTPGYDHPLYILPFDHCGTFVSKMFGAKGSPTAEQSSQIVAMKRIIYDGYRTALAAGAPPQKTGILVDEQFGAAVLQDAATAGYTTALTVEKSGQDEFDFGYGEDSAAHIESFRPTFAKVLVRYNPDGGSALNARQTARLKQLSDYLHRDRRPRPNGVTLFMFELLVSPTREQLDRCGGYKKVFDQEIRPRLMMRTIRDLHAAGIEPDVWKIEGLDRREDCEQVAKCARVGNREKVGCIVLGRGEDDRKVREWLATAAPVPGFIGFAVGRTTFWDAVDNWRIGATTREKAVAEIAGHFREWVDIFEKARAS
jgi:5-dehydro-2-deoxygluconokinase